MMGCLPGRRTFWASLAAALLVAASGCAEDESLTLLRPEGPPEVLQVFVDADEDPTYDVNPAVADLVHGHALTFGSHRDINEGAPVESAADISTTTTMHIVLDELLDGSTVEQFKCACWTFVTEEGETTLAADESGCLDANDEPIGPLYNLSANVNACTGCPDDPRTTIEDETNRCEDANNDTVPDDSVLIEGIFEMTCANSVFTAAMDGGRYTSSTDEGWYTPVGSQLIASVFAGGVLSLGPALQLFPSEFLAGSVSGDIHGFMPTDTTCTLTVSPQGQITDKDGIPLPATPIEFHTSPLFLAAATPPPPTSTTPTNMVAPSPATGSLYATVQLTFNAPLAATALTLATLTGSTFPVIPRFAVNPLLGPDAAVVQLRVLGGFTPSAMHTVTIPATITDVWGSMLGTTFSTTPMDAYSFTTIAYPATFGLRGAAFGPLTATGGSPSASDAATQVIISFSEPVEDSQANFALIAAVSCGTMDTTCATPVTLTNVGIYQHPSPAMAIPTLVTATIPAQGFSKRVEFTVKTGFKNSTGMKMTAADAKVTVTTRAMPAAKK